MNNDILAAAILTAGFVGVQRQAISGGRVDDSIREKFIEYLAFVREQAKAGSAKKKK